jgi:hypothetical protein
MRNFVFFIVLFTLIGLGMTKKIKTKECKDYYRVTELCVEYDTNYMCVKQEKINIHYVCHSTGGSYKSNCECYPE